MNDKESLGYLKLLLALQICDLEECWFDGYNHAPTESLDSNPYSMFSVEHHYWREGWWTGFHTKECQNDEHVNIDSNMDFSQYYFGNESSPKSLMPFKIYQINQMQQSSNVQTSKSLEQHLVEN